MKKPPVRENEYTESEEPELVKEYCWTSLIGSAVEKAISNSIRSTAANLHECWEPCPG